MQPDDLLNDWTLDLDPEARAAYAAMREAERDWIAAIDGRALTATPDGLVPVGRDLTDGGEPVPRRTLVVAHRLALPPLDAVRRTRAAFRAACRALAAAQDRPDTMGARSTALPVWLAPAGPLPVDQAPGALPAALRVRWRTAPAWRGGWLAAEAVERFLRLRLGAAHQTARNAAKLHGKRRAEREATAAEALERARQHLASFAELRERLAPGERLSGRVASGTGWHWTLVARDAAGARLGWTATFPAVGLVHGTEATAIERAPERAGRDTGLERVAAFGSLRLYRVRPGSTAPA